MKKLVLSAALAASALTGAGAAYAAGQAAPAYQTAPQAAPMPPRHHGNPLMRADANGDGVVTRAEVIADADRRFTEMDTNRDGKVTADEFAAMREQRMERRQHRTQQGGDQGPPPADMSAPRGPGRGMDPNRDGTITQAEFRDRATKMFDRADANHDGRVDTNEMAAMRDLHRMRAPAGATPVPPTGDQ